MTVRELIEHLRDMPSDAQIAAGEAQVKGKESVFLFGVEPSKTTVVIQANLGYRHFTDIKAADCVPVELTS